MKLNTARIALSASLVLGTAMLAVSANGQNVDREAQYSSVLQQIANKKLAIAQRQAYLATQQSQIDSLKSQIESVPAIKESIRPMVIEMTAEMEKAINTDLPFRDQERTGRLEDLKIDISDATVGESVIFRKAITMYDIETNYGNSVGTYTGPNPVKPGGRLEACEKDLRSVSCAFTDDLSAAMAGGAKLEDLVKEGSLYDGNYIHFGRLAFLYLEVDSSEGYRYNKASRAWEEVSSGEIIGLRRAVRVARGESAAGVVKAPVMLDPAP